MAVELYFLSPSGHLMMASFSADTPHRIGTPSALLETRLVAHPDRGNFAAYEYDVASGGSRFLVNRLTSPPRQQHDRHRRLESAAVIQVLPRASSPTTSV